MTPWRLCVTSTHLSNSEELKLLLLPPQVRLLPLEQGLLLLLLLGAHTAPAAASLLLLGSCSALQQSTSWALRAQTGFISLQTRAWTRLTYSGAAAEGRITAMGTERVPLTHLRAPKSCDATPTMLRVMKLNACMVQGADSCCKSSTGLCALRECSGVEGIEYYRCFIRSRI